jgi:hypothetical protein
MRTAKHLRKPPGGDPSKHHNLLNQAMRSWRQSTRSGPNCSVWSVREEIIQLIEKDGKVERQNNSRLD